MEERNLRQIPFAALLTAAGILLPQFFHLLGLGAAFLPMFLPVMLGAMFLSWPFALLTAILSPGISWLLTGMPPIVPPILPILALELILAAVIISILRQQTSFSALITLLIAIIIDRVFLLTVVYLVSPLFSIDHPLFSIALVAGGLPGIILQIFVIPASVRLIEQKYPQWKPQPEVRY